MRILVAGASGFVGTALIPALIAAGNDVRMLVRGAPVRLEQRQWHPEEGKIAMEDVAWADCIVNLSGKNVAEGRWTTSGRLELMRSRLNPTRTLVRAFRETGQPTQKCLINASAVGYYGDRGDELLTEAAGPGAGFLAGLCRDWEAAASEAAAYGVRVACLRFGMVIGRGGGALARMVPIFRRGLGGRLGSGLGWTSWISMDDLVRAIGRVAEDKGMRGGINVVSPRPVTNREFTRALGDAVGRPALFRIPAWVLRAAYGAMAQEVLLASVRVEPRKLLDRGFVFGDEAIEGVLARLCGKGSGQD